jgi:Peptidase family M28
MRQITLLLGIALLLLGALALKDALITLPSPPAAANAAGFDANRAVARLQRILGDERPHTVDSTNGDAVRGRLIAEMRAVGLDPRVTDDFTCNNNRRSRNINCARIRNLVATIGPAAGSHLVLVSHYDSTFAGPGASDDGIGVATMLEVAAQMRGRPLARPVTFLIDEGEEMGLIGARAFLERDPVAAHVGTLVNFESRGVTGPAIMFETNRPNGAAIALYRAAAARPLANSLSTDLYGLIPNSTDVSVFDERPWTMLNFAVIGNETHYHSMGDNLASLDLRSLQHMGDQALAVTERAAAGDPAPAGTRLYADLGGRVLIVLPLIVGLVLIAILSFFFVGASWRRQAMGRPLLAMALAIGGSTLLALAGHVVVQLIRPGDYWRAWPMVTSTAVYAAALAACVAALLLVAGTAERTRLRAAFWLAFLIIGGAICLIAPGAAIYFLAPPLVAALGMALKPRLPWAERAGAIVAALLLYVTFGPALGLFEILMNGGPLWAFAPLGAMIMLPALIELWPLVTRGRTLFAIVGALDLAVTIWIVAAFMPAYSFDRQQLFTVEYVWDETAHAARFAVNNDGAPVPYAADWSRAEMPYTTRRRWAAPAPAPRPGAIPLGPRIEEVGRAPAAGGGVRLRLRIAANGAESVALIAPGDAPLRAAGAGASMHPFGAGKADDRYAIRCIGRACDGAVLDIVLARPAPVAFTVVGTRSGLPPEAAPLAGARGALARPQYGPDATITIGRFRFGGEMR